MKMNLQISSGLAPIALFVYSRPEHTQRTLEALRANRLAASSSLIVFSDGAKNEKAVPLVEQVRRYIDGIDGFASVTVVKRDKNWGLANSIIDGVTQVVGQYGKIIVLEDDLVTSPYFLDYMNDGLELYENEPEVSTIQAHIYPLDLPSLPQSYFLPSLGCWGWGTWKRAWDFFEANGKVSLNKLMNENLCSKFDFDGSYPYTDLLIKSNTGRVDSWAVRWYASNFIYDKKGLYPSKSFVENIGFDGTGIHCGKTDVKFTGGLATEYTRLKKIPIIVNEEVYESVRRYFFSIRPLRNFFKRALNKLKRMFSR
jgi:hypothetical protein